MMAYKIEGIMNSWVTAKLIPRVEKREELAICRGKSSASDWFSIKRHTSVFQFSLHKSALSMQLPYADHTVTGI
jgi:hypothetical protein